MKLKSLKYFPITLNFTKQFRTAQSDQKTRQTFILQCENEDGRVIYGEAAPLPEFGSETTQAVERELNKFSDSFFFEFKNTLNSLFDYIDSLNTLPTIQYGLEYIFLQNLFLFDDKLSKGLLESTDINVNAVIDIDNLDSSKKRLKNIADKNYKVVKVKASNENFGALVDLISWAETEIETNLKFRVDPNGSWSINDSLKRAARLEKFRVEYIEQPVKSIDDLFTVAEYSPIPIAADESVRNLDEAKQAIHNSKIKFLVIKPMLFGGLTNINKLKELTKDKDVNIIISSSLESNIGRRHLALIAANTKNNLAHGLDTAGLFINQPTEDVFAAFDGVINFSSTKYLSVMDIKQT